MDIALQKLGTLGYQRIELVMKNPAHSDIKQLKNLLNRNQLQLVCLCTGHVYGEDHLGLVTPNLEINRQAIERLKTIVDFAASINEARIMINIGRTRGG